MKIRFQYIFVIFLLFTFIVLLDRINLNTKKHAIEYIQNRINTLQKNIEKYSQSTKDILLVEKENKYTINSLSDWGINNLQDIYRHDFIVNNTGWYWIIHQNGKHFVLKLKYIYPVNNQYLQQCYSECLNISNEYKLEYSDTARVVKINSEAYFPFTIKEFPKYKYKFLLNLNTALYIFWWLFLFYFLINLYPKPLWHIISLILVVILRWLFYQWNPLELLNESVFYDARVYAFTQSYLLIYFGDVIITVLIYFIFSFFQLKYKNIAYNYLNILLNIFLLIFSIYLFTHHASFTLNILDILFYDYQEWFHTVIALFLVFGLAINLSFILRKYFFQRYTLYSIVFLSVIVLFAATYLIFYYQKNILKSKVEYIFNWIENEEQLAFYEQLQIIDKNLSKLDTLDDNLYFKIISDIENSSIYLQLSKRYLFEDSLSLNKFLKYKDNVWNNVYTDNSAANVWANKKRISNYSVKSIYYLNKLGKKYLLSIFDYTLPFSGQAYYSFLSDRVFQLPSGFRNFNIAFYEYNHLKFRLGNIHFPKILSEVQMLYKLYPDYDYYQKTYNNQSIIVFSDKVSLKRFISLFSVYFVILLSVVLILIYVYYVFNYRHLFPLKHLSYLYKITGLVMFILIISFYLVFIFSYRYIYRLLNNQIKAELIKETQNFDFYHPNENVFIFNDDGTIKSSEIHKKLIKFKLLPSILPDKWIKEIKKNKVLHVKRQIGKYQYSSLFTLYQSDSGSVHIIEFPYFDELYFFEKNLYGLLSPLFNIYALLFFISFLIGIFLSNYIVLPIQKVAKNLKSNALPLDLNTIDYRSEDELGELVKNYNHLILHLQNVMEQLKKEQQEKAWKLMAQQVAHDIKNSLTPLLLNIEYLKKQQNISETHHKILDSTIQQIKMLSRIAEDFSEFAQDIQTKIENTNIIQLIKNIVVQYDKYKDIKINLLIPDDRIIINTDAYLFSRILMNLIKNSMDAMNYQGTINVRVQEKNNEIIVIIEDNGKGIPKDIQNKIFEPKFSTKTSGKGLGLSIVKNICDKLNIKISFESIENKGTTFYLKIPRD